MAKKKPSTPKRILNPFLLSLAAATGWAASQASYVFISFATFGAWLISALAVGLIVRAALAIIIPLLKLGSEFIQHLLNPDRINDRSDIK